MRTFECRECGALNRVPESVAEAREYGQAEGYIRVGRNIYRLPKPCGGSHTFQPPGMEHKAAADPLASLDGAQSGGGGCHDGGDCGDCGCSGQ
jgi:hypothetical protein